MVPGQDETLTQVVDHLRFRLRCVAALMMYEDDVKTMIRDNGIDIDLQGSPSIKTLLQGSPDMLPVPENICQHLLSKDEIRDTLLKNINGVSNVAELDLVKESWSSTKSALKMFEKGLMQAVKDSKSYVEKQVKEASRLQKAEQKKRDKDHMELYKQTADARAKALLASKSQANAKPAYKACQLMFEKFQSAATDLPGLAVKKFPKLQEGQDMSLPWYACDKENADLQSWVADAVVKKTTEAFALKYKTLPDYVQKGRCSGALESKHGKEQCDKLFTTFVPAVLDAAQMPSCDNFMKTAYICGYSPDMRFAGLQANGALTLKAAQLGEVLHVAFSLAGLQDALDKASILAKDKSLANPEAFCEVVENLDVDGFLKLGQHGLNIFLHKQVPGEIISIPMGWFSFEVTMKGPLVVCARKGFFLTKASEQTLSEYRSLRDMFKRCGKNTDRYDQLLELLAASSAK